MNKNRYIIYVFKESEKIMEYRCKVILIIILIFILINIVATILVGNYFVNFALVRNDDNEFDISPDADKSIPDFVKDEIAENIGKEENLVQEWLKTVSTNTVNILSDDNLKLIADKYYTESNSNKWVIIVHGYGGNRKTMRSYAVHYFNEGYNVLIPDLRAHGESEGKYIGMGWLDRNDLLLWIDYIIKENPNAEIVLHGVSMGAATVMMTSGENLPNQVKAIIEDCGYTSVWDIFEDELDALFGLDAFPVLYMSEFVAKIRVGYDFSDASAIKQVEKCKIPILFIHGDKDTFVQTHMAYDLYDAANCEKDLFIVEDAGHAEAKNRNPEAYFEKVFQFLKGKIN